ncbi:unnamed protein product [uncultured bacterium]|nr:unnamed protein product [uncultured bacterium]
MLRVVLIANYAPDAQPSMQRFADLLHRELAARGVDVEMWRPPPSVGGRNPADGPVHKWLGYVDKYVLYPPRLSQAAARLPDDATTVFHVCDHSNAMYVRCLRNRPHVVTCHDLIAVRRALGEFPDVSIRWTGRKLQAMIRSGLRQAHRIVCDSEATRGDVRRLVGMDAGETIIRPGVATAFHPVSRDEAAARLAALKLPARFLLHVGGSQWYKNRIGLLDLYAALLTRAPEAPPIVLAGKPLTSQEASHVAARRLHDRVITVASVADSDLAALYSAAELLVFPSLVEGFGWPVLEAMACGCRVVASNRAPMTEVGGEAATYLDPQDPVSASATVAAVLSEPEGDRRARIAAGLARVSLFSTGAMADAYLAVYHDALARRSHAA